MSTTTCPGCKVVLPAHDGPTHAYYGCSAECWARFGEVLALEYQDPAYAGVHQLTVDTYAVQHPGSPERRTIQSVAVHLMTLGMIIESGLDPREGPRLHKEMVDHASLFEWLDPPEQNGRLTVVDVIGSRDAPDHERRVRAWGEDVWTAWAAHHDTIWRWIQAIVP